MARTTAQRILVLDNDAALRREVHQALHAASVEVASGPLEVRGAVDAVNTFKPTLLWVHAELGSDGLGTLLAALERSAVSEVVPVVLLCKDARDAPLVRTMKTGIVEVLQEPFSARLHLARLRLLPLELPDRTGELRGRGTGRDLSALFGHIIRSHRTGGVVVNEGQPDVGHAFFVNGVLQSATFRGLQKQQALGALNSLSGNIDWHFKEGADGSGALIDLDTLPDAGDGEEFVISRGHGDSEVIGAAPAPASASVAPAVAPAIAPVVPKVAPAVPSVAPVARAAQVSAPAVPAAAAAAATPAMSPNAAPPAPTPAVSANAAPDAATTPVLFVDDDPSLAKMFSSYFAKLGYPVLTASDGIDAIGKLLQSPSEIVIADLNMPRLDGWGFLKAVREDFRTNEMPVALFSCHDDYRESLRAMHAGAQAYYPKSLRMSALELQVRELLEPRRRFRRILSTGQSVTFNLSAVGPQWALKQVAAQKVMGQLDAQDGWAVYRLHFNLGQLAQISATASGRALPKERALMSFLSSKGLEGSFLFSNAPVASMFNNQPTQVLLDAAVQALNDEQKKLRDDQLKEAKALDVNPELYSLYLTVGPPPWRPMVQALCEQRLLPRDVMTRLNVTAAELSQCLKDLVRRGVVTLRTSAPT